MILEYLDEKTHKSHKIVCSHNAITNAQKSYKPITALQWDHLSDEDQAIITENTQDLRLICQIDTIKAENHPCKGEKGLFSKRFMRPGDYIGEYVGTVLGGNA